MAPSPASPRRGLALALRLWRVVGAVWLVSALLLLPVGVGLWSTLSGPLGELPESGLLPAGESLLVATGGLGHVLPILVGLLLLGLVAEAAWVPLWHAGVVRWRTWAGGRSPSLGEVLGLGAGVWFRYLRLAVTGGVGLVILLLVVWIPLGGAAAAARSDLAEVRSVNLQLLALGLGLLVVLVVLAATERAAWILGEPGRRSAALAWGAGLARTLRRPLSSLGTALLWLVAGAVCAKGPVLLGLVIPALREGSVSLLVAAVGGLGAAVCWVALLGSYSPAPPEPEEEPAATPRPGPAHATPALPTAEPPQVAIVDEPVLLPAEPEMPAELPLEEEPGLPPLVDEEPALPDDDELPRPLPPADDAEAAERSETPAEDDRPTP